VGRQLTEDLTARQEKLLLFCVDYNLKEGSFPPLRVIGAHMAIRSTNGVNDHLRALERKGFMELDKYRGYKLTDQGWQYGEVVAMFGRFTKDKEADED
jgi:repressor LexA